MRKTSVWTTLFKLLYRENFASNPLFLNIWKFERRVHFRNLAYIQ